MNPIEQQFFNDLEKKLWTAADKLRSSLDASVYIRKHEHVLTPGRYVGAEEQEEDGEAFADKMARLTTQLAEQFGESAKLEGEIKKNLAGLGYAISEKDV